MLYEEYSLRNNKIKPKVAAHPVSFNTKVIFYKYNLISTNVVDQYFCIYKQSFLPEFFIFTSHTFRTHVHHRADQVFEFNFSLHNFFTDHAVSG